jgi:predicted acetylornithine/succinylornithine family transaminase
MKSMRVIEQGNKVFMNNYAQFPLVLHSGKGSTVFDVDGKSYVDMVAGIAVNILGYDNQELNTALMKTIERGLFHCSNLYWNEQAVEAAGRIASLGEMDRVFFCNSGTEAIEAAIKLVRKAGSAKDPKKTDIITMEHSFHGRTYGSMTATGQTKYQKGFAPILPGFSYAPFNDIEKVTSLVTERTCAIIVEPVQGEGGIVPADKAFLKGLRTLCDTHDMLLVYDEVQCGLGRTGYPFAWQAYQVKPDVIAMAKALGSGIPMGAIAAHGTAALVFEPGDHAATFGGNLLSATAANVVLSKLADKRFLQHVHTGAAQLHKRFMQLKERFSFITDEIGRAHV